MLNSNLFGMVNNIVALMALPLRWRDNGRDSVSNHQPHDCLLNRLFRRRSKKTSKLRVIGLFAGNSPGTGEFPAQMASNAENVCIWWRHHGDIRSLSPIRWKIIAKTRTVVLGTLCLVIGYQWNAHSKISYIKWRTIQMFARVFFFFLYRNILIDDKVTSTQSTFLYSVIT